METYDITLLICEMISKFEDQKDEILAGIKSPYYDNEEYHWYCNELDHVYKLEDSDCIAVLSTLGYDKKVILKTYKEQDNV